MRTELPRMGHEVTVCADGIEAVEALSRQSFDCLLVDLNMPGLNGIEVIEQARKIAPNTDSIVLTGKGTFESAIASIRNHVESRHVQVDQQTVKRLSRKGLHRLDAICADGYFVSHARQFCAH